MNDFISIDVKHLDKDTTKVLICKLMPWRMEDTVLDPEYFICYDYYPGLDTDMNKIASLSFRVSKEEYDRVTEIYHDFENNPNKYLNSKDN